MCVKSCIRTHLNQAGISHTHARTHKTARLKRLYTYSLRNDQFQLLKTEHCKLNWSFLQGCCIVLHQTVQVFMLLCPEPRLDWTWKWHERVAQTFATMAKSMWTQTLQPCLNVWFWLNCIDWFAPIQTASVVLVDQIWLTVSVLVHPKGARWG